MNKKLEKIEISKDDLNEIQSKLCSTSSSLEYITRSMLAIENYSHMKDNPYYGLDDLLMNIKKDLDCIYELTDI